MGAGGDPGRPNTTRRPSRRRTAQIHKGGSGHSGDSSSRKAASCSTMSCRPGAIKDMPAASGRNCKGRLIARCSMCGPGSRSGRRSTLSGRKGASSGTAVSATRCITVLSSDSGAFTVQAARSSAETPRRRRVPVMEPAEVPTTTSAVRASKPKSCSSTARTAEW
jgi:hypothetical protein